MFCGDLPGRRRNKPTSKLSWEWWEREREPLSLSLLPPRELARRLRGNEMSGKSYRRFKDNHVKKDNSDDL